MRRVLKAKAEHHAADSGVMADRGAIAAQAAGGDLGVAAGAVKAAVVDVTAFRMKIIASPQDSRANHAGNFFLPWLGWTAGPVHWPHSALRRSDGNNISKTAKRNEADRPAQNEGRTTRPT